MIKYQTPLGLKFDPDIPNASEAISKVLDVLETLCKEYNVPIYIDSNKIESGDDLSNLKQNKFEEILKKNSEKFKSADEIQKKFVEYYNDVPSFQIERMEEYEKNMIK